MENFVIVGKAKQVFRLIELAAQREQSEKDMWKVLEAQKKDKEVK